MVFPLHDELRPKKTSARLRFAPSPTGYLHIGGVRTALFNWLWARKTGGSFVLRIEDTDRERSTSESKEVILDSLRWLGMDWDEGPDLGGALGPYTQMERLQIYKTWAEKLIDEGKAYRCYCTKEELDRAREELAKRDPKAQFRYPEICRDQKKNLDKPYVVRFKTYRDGSVTYRDKVFGDVTTPNKELQDFVLLRQDGIPLYNFGAVVDDITMGITLVARGRDHMINTPPQILLYEAFSATIPEFAHLPMMMNQKGAKLSKRDGAVGVFEYRDAGYSPMGVLNYLARFGWSFGDQELFSKEELIQAFSWEACGKADGRFDPKKCLAVNHGQLKNPKLTPDRTYAASLLPFLEKRGLTGLDINRVQALLWLVRDRGQTYVESADKLDPFLREELVHDKTLFAKHVSAQVSPTLRSLANRISALSDQMCTEALFETLFHEFLLEHHLSPKEIGPAIRVALTGRDASPGLLHQVMFTLGPQKSAKRLNDAASMAEKN